MLITSFVLLTAPSVINYTYLTQLFVVFLSNTDFNGCNISVPFISALNWLILLI